MSARLRPLMAAGPGRPGQTVWMAVFDGPPIIRGGRGAVSFCPLSSSVGVQSGSRFPDPLSLLEVTNP